MLRPVGQRFDGYQSLKGRDVPEVSQELSSYLKEYFALSQNVLGREI